MQEKQTYSENSQYAPAWVRRGNYAIGLDQYYTKPAIAQHCYDSFLQIAQKRDIKIAKYTFLEPSAGTGAFLHLLPKGSIGLDLSPKHPSVRQANFLGWQPEDTTQYLAIGNPPFGHRAWLALAFLQRAADFCDLVGFILPMYFASDGKGSAKHRVRKLRLLHSEELPYDIFENAEGKTLSINTVWQIWGKCTEEEQTEIPNCAAYVDIYTVSTAPKRRCGLQRMAHYDFFLQSTFYKPPQVVKSFEEVKYGSGYGIIIKKEKEAIVTALEAANWQKYSIRATNNCRHIGMQHIRKCLWDAGFRDKEPILQHSLDV